MCRLQGAPRTVNTFVTYIWPFSFFKSVSKQLAVDSRLLDLNTPHDSKCRAIGNGNGNCFRKFIFAVKVKVLVKFCSHFGRLRLVILKLLLSRVLYSFAIGCEVFLLHKTI